MFDFDRTTMAEAFAGRELQVTGSDVQKPMLEAARTYIPAVRFERAASRPSR